MGNVNFLENLDDAFELRRWLGERRSILCIDTETGGLNPYRDRLRLVQFGDTESAWAVPAEDWRGFIRDCLQAYDGDLTLHNAKFDAHFLREQVGVELPWERVHDTEIQSHVLFPPGRHGLKYLATQKIHPGAAAGEAALHDAMHRHKVSWATVPVNLKEYWVYGGVDTILCSQLHVMQMEEIRQRGLTGIYELERQVQPVLYNMERHGAAVDLSYCRQKSTAMLAYTEQVREWAKSAYGIDNLGSNVQLAKALIADGVPLDVRTPKGEYSVTEAVLKRFIEHPLVEAVLNLRKYTKIRSSYFDNFLTFASDGVVHPHIRQVGARTGRMAVTDPALQTLPRGREVRDAFVARPGWKIVSIDFEQIEARIFAAFSEDPSLIQAIADYDAGIGPDLHTYCARVVYNDPTIEKKNKRRDLAKNCLVPGTRVLTRDLRWVGVETLKVGDELWGFDEEQNGDKGDHARLRARRMRHAVVLDTGIAVRPVVDVLLSDGTKLTCTYNHKVLVDRHHQVRATWVEAGSLEPGMRVNRYFDVWDEIRPERLIDGIPDGMTMQRIGGASVVSVVPAGEQPVVLLETDTKTYFAEGLASHNTTFCTMFGGGAAKIATTAGVPLADAEGFLRVYLERFPGVRRFQRAVDTEAKRCMDEHGVAYITTVHGRYLPLVDQEGYYKLVNYRIQGSAADIFKRQLVNVANAGFLPYLVMAVHDEIILEMPEEWVGDAIPHLKTAMEDHASLQVPILANASTPEDSWGACK